VKRKVGGVGSFCFGLRCDNLVQRTNRYGRNEIDRWRFALVLFFVLFFIPFVIVTRLNGVFHCVNYFYVDERVGKRDFVVRRGFDYLDYSLS
jgi:hypothetical protein